MAHHGRPASADDLTLRQQVPLPGLTGCSLIGGKAGMGRARDLPLSEGGWGTVRPLSRHSSGEQMRLRVPRRPNPPHGLRANVVHTGAENQPPRLQHDREWHSIQPRLLKGQYTHNIRYESTRKCYSENVCSRERETWRQVTSQQILQKRNCSQCSCTPVRSTAPSKAAR